MKLNPAKSTVTLQTEKKSKTGQPLISWEMNTKTGKVKQTTRNEDDDDVEVDERGDGTDLDDADLDDGPDGPNTLIEVSTPADIDMDFADLER